MRPFFKWVGGKQRMIPKYRSYGLIPASAHERLYEPFCGGGAMTLNIQPKQAFLNDIAPPVWSFWITVLLCPKELHAIISKSQDDLIGNCMNRDDFKRAYLAKRNEYNNKLVEIRSIPVPPLSQLCSLVDLFLFLNKNGYNGLYRVNSSGLYNVPVGDKVMPTKWLPNLDTLLSIKPNLSVSRKDYSEYLTTSIPSSSNSPRSFIFVDPPYYGKYARYTKGEFSPQDHHQLKYLLDNLAGIHDIAVASTENSDMLDLYKDWNLHHLSNYTTLGSGSSKRQNEVLITNY